MGKQLSIYLDEQEAKRLAEMAQRECRRPVDQVRFMLRRSLGLSENQQVEVISKKQNGAGVRQDRASAVP
jgi:hypothetical protein